MEIAVLAHLAVKIALVYLFALIAIMIFDFLMGAAKGLAQMVISYKEKIVLLVQRTAKNVPEKQKIIVFLALLDMVF